MQGFIYTFEQRTDHWSRLHATTVNFTCLHSQGPTFSPTHHLPTMLPATTATQLAWMMQMALSGPQVFYFLILFSELTNIVLGFKFCLWTSNLSRLHSLHPLHSLNPCLTTTTKGRRTSESATSTHYTHAGTRQRQQRLQQMCQTTTEAQAQQMQVGTFFCIPFF